MQEKHMGQLMAAGLIFAIFLCEGLVASLMGGAQEMSMLPTKEVTTTTTIPTTTTTTTTSTTSTTTKPTTTTSTSTTTTTTCPKGYKTNSYGNCVKPIPCDRYENCSNIPSGRDPEHSCGGFALY